MELLCRIKQQLPLEEREYTNQQGNVERFSSMGFVLSSGRDEFYCEMVQEQARRQGPVSSDRIYSAVVTSTARTWKDQQGRTHYENRIILISLAPL